MAELGLIGKVSLNNTWDKAAVASEISSIFRKVFNLEDNEEMPFQYLRYVLSVTQCGIVGSFRKEIL